MAFRIRHWPVRPHQPICLLGALLAFLVLVAACQQQSAEPVAKASPTVSPSPSPTVSPSPSPTEEPRTVLGNMQVGFIPATDQAKVPKPPITVTTVLKPLGGGQRIEQEITDPRGAFALTLPPGRYRVESLLVESPSISNDALDVPTGGPVFTAPKTGCVYVGRIFYFYLRLPRGGLKAQQGALISLVEQGKVDPNNAYMIYVRTGGLVPSTAGVDLGSKKARPDGWEDCTLKKARF